MPDRFVGYITDSVVSEDLESESGSSKIIITPKKGKKRRKVVYFFWSLGGFFFTSNVRYVCLRRREKHIFKIEFFVESGDKMICGRIGI